MTHRDTSRCVPRSAPPPVPDPHGRPIVQMLVTDGPVRDHPGWSGRNRLGAHQTRSLRVRTTYLPGICREHRIWDGLACRSPGSPGTPQLCQISIDVRTPSERGIHSAPEKPSLRRIRLALSTIYHACAGTHMNRGVVDNRLAERYLAGAAIALIAFSVCLAGAQIALAHHNTCRLYSPAPAGADVSEERFAEVVETVSLWPLGDVCDWPRADGKVGSVQYRQGSYPLTIFTYTLAVAGVASGAVALTRTRRRTRTWQTSCSTLAAEGADREAPGSQK